MQPEWLLGGTDASSGGEKPGAPYRPEQGLQPPPHPKKKNKKHDPGFWFDPPKMSLASSAR